MKNPVLIYILVRIALFATFLAGLLALQINEFFAAVCAAILSFSVSLIFLNKSRSKFSEAIAKRVTKVAKDGIEDSDSDYENQLLDK